MTPAAPKSTAGAKRPSRHVRPAIASRSRRERAPTPAFAAPRRYARKSAAFTPASRTSAHARPTRAAPIPAAAATSKPEPPAKPKTAIPRTPRIASAAPSYTPEATSIHGVSGCRHAGIPLPAWRIFPWQRRNAAAAAPTTTCRAGDGQKRSAATAG